MLFLISKTVGLLIIPPGIFVLLLLTSIFLFLLNRKRAALITLTITLLSLYVLSTEFGKNLLIRPLEEMYPYPRSVNCEEIVVLGGGIIPNSPDENGKASVEPRVSKRLFTAFKLWKRTGKPILLSGGKVFWKGESESEAMRRFLTEIGVPKEAITEEKRSRNTLENALFSKEILERKGINQICLVTSAYHMPRSVLIFKEVGLKVTPVPSDYRAFRAPYGWYSFLPMPSNLRDSMLAMREYIGIVYFLTLQRWKLKKHR